jgi:hypothetical protein
MAWERVTDPASGRLLFRIDRERGLLEAMNIYWDKEKNQRVRYAVVIDLKTLLQASPTLEPQVAQDAAPSV